MAKQQLSMDQNPGLRVGIIKSLMIRLKNRYLESGLRVKGLRLRVKTQDGKRLG